MSANGEGALFIWSLGSICCGEAFVLRKEKPEAFHFLRFSVCFPIGFLGKFTGDA